MCTNKKNNFYIAYRVKQLCEYMFFPFIAFSFSNIAIAQTADSTNNSLINQQIWIDFYPHYYVNEKLEYYGDAGYRTIVSERSWSRLYVRPSLKYHLNEKWEFHAGLGLFYIFNKYDADQFEMTPWQGVQLNWPTFKRISFKNLAKLEERLSFETKDWASTLEFRFRYKLSGKINLLKLKTWFIPFYGEYFFPIKGEIKEIYRNKGRVGLGLGFKPTKNWQVSFIFNWQGSRTGSNDKLNVSDYAYQLKIKKVWNKILFK